MCVCVSEREREKERERERETDRDTERETGRDRDCFRVHFYMCRGVVWGVEGKQVGSMDEEPQVRGCYNLTFICTPTNQETVYWKTHKQTKHLEHESKCKV